MHEEDGSEANSPTASRIVASKSLDVAEVDGPKDQPAKLCGHLTKLAGKGPLRGYKPRWFVYDPRKCYLYYFKTPQDALPLGYMEIGDACFSYDVEGDEGQFEIHTTGKEFLLKVEGHTGCDSLLVHVFPYLEIWRAVVPFSGIGVTPIPTGLSCKLVSQHSVTLNLLSGYI